MQELMRNAWAGWSGYITDGKYAVLLLGILLIYLFGRMKAKQEFSGNGVLQLLMTYTSAVTVLAVCPMTAALLMMYQTRFYDYMWVFSLIPVTLVIACGFVCLGREVAKKYRPVYVLFCLVLVLLCGNLDRQSESREEQAADREICMTLLDKLSEKGNTENICLWAPKDLMTHMRSLDGGIRLLYGRNLWDTSLNAYTYDTYDRETVSLYEWMEEIALVLPVPDPEAALTDEKALKLAIEKGVSCMILPAEQDGRLSESLLEAEQECNVTVSSDDAEGYWIVWIERSVS